MNSFELFSFGSSDCLNLKEFSPKDEFFISVEFDLKKQNEEGIMTFFFFLATKEGYYNQPYHDELEHIIIVEKYSFEFVRRMLDKKIVNKITELSDKRLLEYLHSIFNFSDD
ncbi:hypothetical protein [Flammeovirga sp. SJP92]|uniref:hypothetical protein n=1 Tax=Flammeovirga sp. SJP92 TaxID=1775430 RepID=UPI0007892FE9|nr:hypothetical protein [Flammeovirga sp. SJP92]KXX70878.1 hypothetical protein AVL50_10930 [Flammeovirga sp. SJP92]